MAIDDLKTEAGVKSLDTYLADRSFVSGFQASQADVGVFEALAKPPSKDTPHALRWYNHIKSYGGERGKLPGEKKVPDLFSVAAVGNGSAPAAKQEEDDDVDLFGSDEEDEEAAKIREERLKAYSEKKSKKPALIAKSSIVLDVKPWDDETDMKEMETKVRTIQMDGLLWGASKLVPVGYGINKLQIMCVVEDEKVSVDLLVEEIQNFEDFVQSVDIAAFNKI
ncbi:elongation factor 1-beta'-like [Bacillus rossius redtenbacheri]|uniref:elongation factor 1-beta'-like n=1 Tax=Bacillus rossius redtenbacheri TaxID=93214 RepID=UPI002FDDEB03